MSKWFEELNQKLESLEESDEEIIEFIHTRFPSDESELFDNKKELYVNDDDSDDEMEKKISFVKSISSLANVIHESRKRYLLVGFNDDTDFVGCDFYGEADDRYHVLNQDDASLQNILEQYLYPVPSISKYDLETEEESGSILVIDSIDRPPSIIQETVKISDDKERLSTEKMAHTRNGSKITKIDHDYILSVIEQKEDLIKEKFQEVTENFDKVMGLSPSELEKVDLEVTTSDDGFPVEQVLDTQGTDDINEALNTAVKYWNTHGSVQFNESSLLMYYKQKDELELDREKSEFLFRASLLNEMVGATWLLERENSEINEILKRAIEELEIRPTMLIDQLLLILRNANLLNELKSQIERRNPKKRISRYIQNCDGGLEERAKLIKNSEIWHGDKIYHPAEYEERKGEIEGSFNQVIEDYSEGNVRKEKIREFELLRATELVNA